MNFLWRPPAGRPQEEYSSGTQLTIYSGLRGRDVFVKGSGRFLLQLGLIGFA
jgi:hypothetical protein